MSARRLAIWILLISVSAAGSSFPASAASDGAPALAVPAAGPASDPAPQEPGEDVALEGVARVLVAGETGTEALQRVAARHGAAIVDDLPALDLVVLESSDLEGDELAARLEAEPGVTGVVVDHRRQLFMPIRYPNDPYNDDQMADQALVRAPNAWAITTGSSEVVVAVLDTGVDRAHPDLKGRVLAGRDLVAGGTRPPDPHGHGTAVAGIIAARGDDRTGIAGIAWESRILPVRVLDEHGWGWDSDVAAGIVWAADQGAKVINLSLGGPDPSPVLDAAIDHAMGRGALVVAAAGNDGSDEPMYPAASPGAVAVGAVNFFGDLTDFSSFGDWVDLTAPGVEVLTTIPVADGGYAYVSGTSIAAPFVSGAAALMLARSPSRTPAQLRTTLRTTARDAGPPGIDPFLGWGVLDIAAALGGAKGDPLFAPTYDDHEPNDLPGHATVMPAGATMWATMSPEGDVDWYRQDLTEPRRVTVTVTPPKLGPWYSPTSLEPIVALLDEDLRVVAADVGGPVGNLTVTATLPAGAVYVYVANLNGSAPAHSYRLTITTADAPPFRAPVRLVEGPLTAEALAAGDVTGDGVDDLVVTSRGTNAGLRVVPGLSDGGVGEPVFHATGALDYRGAGVAIVDLDADGDLDVVVATTTGLQAFHQHDGTLTRADGPAAPFAPSTRPMLLAVDDVTGDGVDELVSTGFDGTWVHARGEPDGGWGRTQLTATRYLDLEVADLDGDGSAEVVGLTSARTMHVHRLADDVWAETVTTTSTGVGEEPRAMAVADTDADGLLDVVVTVGSSASTTNVRALLQQPDGSFVAGTPRAVSTSPDVAVSDDVDGDGAADVVIVHRATPRISLVPGDGSGGFAAPRTAGAVSASALLNVHSVVLYDLDADGQLDVVAAADNGLHAYLGGVERLDGPSDVWIRRASPAPHARNASATPTITIDVARPLSASSVTSSTVRLRDGRTGAAISATRSYDATKRRITLVPTAPLIAGATYRVDVTGVRDVDGVRNDDPLRMPFTVARDKTKPGPVTGLTPAGRLDAMDLTWTNPTDADLDHVEVRVGFDGYPGLNSGMVWYRGRATKLSIPRTNLAGGYISVYAFDRSGNASSRATLRTRPAAIDGTATGTVTHGARVTVSGQLWNPGNGAALAGRSVDLLHRPAGTSTWTRVATATTTKDGTVTFSRKPSVTAAYRLRFRGEGSYLGEQRTIGTIKVRSAVSATLATTSVAKGATVRLSGAVAPAKPGATVEVQRRSADGTWKRIGTAKLRSDSTYRFDITASSKGTHSYRVRMPADTSNVLGTSPTVKLTVK